MNRRRVAIALLATTFAIGACSSAGDDAGTSSEPTVRPTATVPAGVPYEAGTAPAAFRDRAPLPDCGVHRRDLRTMEFPQDATRCLTDATGTAEGAELVLLGNTIEGDPIVDYYRALPGGRVEHFSDSTHDEWGSQVWSVKTCDTLTFRRGTVVSSKGCSPRAEFLAGQLIGTWTPTAFGDVQGRPLDRLDRTRLALTFAENGTFVAGDGCHVFTGRFTVDDRGAFGTTGVDVPQELCRHAAPAVDVLVTSVRVSLGADGRLRFYRDDRVVADYEPADGRISGRAAGSPAGRR